MDWENADEMDLENLKMDFECWAYFIKNKMKEKQLQMQMIISNEFDIGFDKNRIFYLDWFGCFGIGALPKNIKQIIWNALESVLGYSLAKRRIAKSISFRY